MKFGIICIVFFSACTSPGTHGKIRAYQYPLNKYALANNIAKVIDENPNINRDTLKEYDGRVNFYNDIVNYITININEDNNVYRCVFRYYGDSAYWDSAKVSEFALVFATKNGEGGTEGSGDFKNGNSGLEESIIRVFEKEFVEILDKEVSIRHSE